MFSKKINYYCGHREVIHFLILQNKLVSKYFVRSETLGIYEKQVFVIIRYYSISLYNAVLSYKLQ